MFDEAVYDVETDLDVSIGMDTVEVLTEDVQHELTGFMRNYEGRGQVTLNEVDEYFSEELAAVWTLKYPSRDLYDMITSVGNDFDVKIDPYTLFYLNLVQTSIVAQLLYAAALIAKWEGREAPVDEELVSDACQQIYRKKLIHC